MEFLARRFHERNPVFSPDGQWIALTSNQSGQDEIYVKSYSDGAEWCRYPLKVVRNPSGLPTGTSCSIGTGTR